MIVYTASSVEAEAENRSMCMNAVPVPCRMTDCSGVEHSMYCTRAAGHPPDIHIAIATGPDGVAFIGAVWRADLP